MPNVKTWKEFAEKELVLELYSYINVVLAGKPGPESAVALVLSLFDCYVGEDPSDLITLIESLWAVRPGGPKAN